MPSNNQLRAVIAQLTDDLYAKEVILNKTSFKQPDANKIILRALVSYYDLALVDELLSKVLNSTTNMPTENVRAFMRTLWDNKSLRTTNQRTIFMIVHSKLVGNSIGRNQAIEIILSATQEVVNG